MPEGEGPESLSGQFSVHVSAKQSLLLTIDTYQWDSESGLEVEASVYLSQGLSRILEVGISVATQGNPTLLQIITIEADPWKEDVGNILGASNGRFNYHRVDSRRLESGFKLCERHTDLGRDAYR